VKNKNEGLKTLDRQGIQSFLKGYNKKLQEGGEEKCVNAADAVLKKRNRQCVNVKSAEKHLRHRKHVVNNR